MGWSVGGKFAGQPRKVGKDEKGFPQANSEISYLSKQRAKIRNKFGIAGSSGNDWMVACCCPCCALVQHDNEIESRNPKMRQNVDTQGYQANTNSMVMPERGSWYNSGDMAADMHRQSQR